jgi:hypothetical protein
MFDPRDVHCTTGRVASVLYVVRSVIYVHIHIVELTYHVYRIPHTHLAGSTYHLSAYVAMDRGAADRRKSRGSALATQYRKSGPGEGGNRSESSGSDRAKKNLGPDP